MAMFVAQLTSLALLFLGPFLFGILPVLCFRCCGCFGTQRERGRRKATSAASYLMNFGGGVLLSVALLQLLPRAREEMASGGDFKSINITGNTSSGHEHHHQSGHHHHHHSIPMAELTVGCGFFLAYVVDMILHSILDRPKRAAGELRNPTFRDRFCSCSMRNIECSRPFKHKGLTPHPAALSEKRRRSATWDGALMGSRRPEEKSQILSPPDILQSSFISRPNYGTLAAPQMKPIQPEQSPTMECQHGRLIQGEGGITLTTRAVAVPPVLPNITEGVIMADSNSATSLSALSVASILVVMALSIPSVIEGMTVGSRQTPHGTWTILLSTVITKIVTSFVIGIIAFFDESKIGLIVACVAIFSSMAPTGMTVAMILGENINDIFPSIAAGVMDSLASGTLLYVIFYELWVKKTWNSRRSHMQFVIRLFGVAFMTALFFLTCLQ